MKKLLGLLTILSALVPQLVEAQTAVYPCIATAGTPAFTEGRPAPCVEDLNGVQGVSLKTATAGEAVADDVLKVEQRGFYTNITLAAPTATTIKSGPGWFHNLIINKAAANGVITCYDNTSAAGTVIATITQPAALLQSSAVFPYDVIFNVGLTCNTATAAQDITISVR